MEVIRDLYERPIAPKDIVEGLKRIDERLDLRYIVHKRLDYANLNIDEKWAIIERWTQNDKRRIMIQRGQMAEDADFDVLCYLPLDCDVEAAKDYFIRTVKGQLREGKDRERMISRIDEYNKKVAAEVVRAEAEKAEELIEANVGTLFEKEKGTGPKKVYMKGS